MARPLSLFLCISLLVAGCASGPITGAPPNVVGALNVETGPAAPALLVAAFSEHLLTFEPDPMAEEELALADLLLEPVAEELPLVEEPSQLELAFGSLEVSAKQLVDPTPVPYTSFRRPIPFRSQKDGSRYQGSNCGPAALAMVFEAYGMVYENDELRFLSHTYQGTVGRRGGTALQHMASVARDLGLETVGLYDGNTFHRWTVDEIRAQLQAGRVVIPLVKYRLLPGHEASTIRFDHYIVIHGVQGDRFLYHDPAYEHAAEGASRWITAAQLDAAIAPTLEPRQAVAIGPGTLAELRIFPI